MMRNIPTRGCLCAQVDTGELVRAEVALEAGRRSSINASRRSSLLTLSNLSSPRGGFSALGDDMGSGAGTPRDGTALSSPRGTGLSI